MTNIIKPRLTPEQQKAREGWKYRAIEAARGNQSKLGCILIRICGRMSRHPPRYDVNSEAYITEGGMVLADMQLNPRKPFLAMTVGHVREIVEAFRKHADKLKLTDAEREEMFGLLRQWIGKDARSTSDPQIAEDRLKAAKKLAKGRMH